MIIVSDGSTDQTVDIVKGLAVQEPRIKLVELRRNQGKSMALMAGFKAATGDIIATIDADLQDDISVIATMIDHFKNGDADIVFGVRSGRASDTFFKRETAALYYRLMDWLGAKIISHHADFRLMSDRAVRAVASWAATSRATMSVALGTPGRSLIEASFANSA